jgi:hypothetical protein
MCSFGSQCCLAALFVKVTCMCCEWHCGHHSRRYRPREPRSKIVAVCSNWIAEIMIYVWMDSWPIPVAANSEVCVCCRSLAGIASSISTGALMSFCCECGVLSGRGHSEGPVTRPEESECHRRTLYRRPRATRFVELWEEKKMDSCNIQVKANAFVAACLWSLDSHTYIVSSIWSCPFRQQTLEGKINEIQVLLFIKF